MTDTFNNIVKWNKEREIPKSFKMEAEFNMLEEELDELYDSSSKRDAVDALADMVVIAVGGMWKLGYDPNIVMNEVLKEINSRGGSYDITTGKWEKEVTGKEYVADYNLAEVING